VNAWHAGEQHVRETARTALFKRELSLVIGSKEPEPGGLDQNISGFVSPNVVKELTLQLFDSGFEPCVGYVENVMCRRLVAASVCVEGVFAKGFDPLYV
jgi:hypothetical protein